MAPMKRLPDSEVSKIIRRWREEEADGPTPPDTTTDTEPDTPKVDLFAEVANERLRPFTATSPRARWWRR